MNLILGILILHDFMVLLGIQHRDSPFMAKFASNFENDVASPVNGKIATGCSARSDQKRYLSLLTGCHNDFKITLYGLAIKLGYAPTKIRRAAIGGSCVQSNCLGTGRNAPLNVFFPNPTPESPGWNHY